MRNRFPTAASALSKKEGLEKPISREPIRHSLYRKGYSRIWIIGPNARLPAPRSDPSTKLVPIRIRGRPCILLFANTYQIGTRIEREKSKSSHRSCGSTNCITKCQESLTKPMDDPKVVYVGIVQVWPLAIFYDTHPEHPSPQRGRLLCRHF